MSFFRLLFCLCAFAAPAAHAGGIAFDLSLTGQALSIVNRGDSSAFYPQVFRLGAGGEWIGLSSTEAPTELRPGATTNFVWGDTAPAERQTAIERLQPVMVRFFDQSGVYFGQVSFFHSPPPTLATLPARYANGVLEIGHPTDGAPIVATWILAPREEGIEPIRRPVFFVHKQPPARRIDWSRAGAMERVDTGEGLPTVFLVHETPTGLVQQTVANGGLQGREQRTGWLNASQRFFLAAKVVGGAGLAFAFFGWVGRWRRKGRK